MAAICPANGTITALRMLGEIEDRTAQRNSASATTRRLSRHHPQHRIKSVTHHAIDGPPSVRDETQWLLISSVYRLDQSCPDT